MTFIWPKDHSSALLAFRNKMRARYDAALATEQHVWGPTPHDGSEGTLIAQAWESVAAEDFRAEFERDHEPTALRYSVFDREYRVKLANNEVVAVPQP